MAQCEARCRKAWNPQALIIITSGTPITISTAVIAPHIAPALIAINAPMPPTISNAGSSRERAAERTGTLVTVIGNKCEGEQAEKETSGDRH
jgi:hypothetical protein